jgi:5'-3' exonuclease-like protein
VRIHVVDGTYELFRHYYALPSARDADGREIAAVRGVLASIRGLLREGATHIGVATDHVIESFRNGLWPGYKTGEGIDPDLFAQFPLLEEALVAAGIVVWPMVEFEADDALAAAAAAAAADPRVERVIICTPDKDLAQCVRGTRVVQLNRRTRTFFDEAGIVAKFGVPPESIPDYLALVGDAADGFPGLAGWARNRPRPSSPSMGTSKRSPPTRATGTSTFRVPPSWRRRCSATGTLRCSFGTSRHSAPTSRCSTTWKRFAGTATSSRYRSSPPRPRHTRCWSILTACRDD